MTYDTTLVARYHVTIENSLGCELDGRFAGSREGDIKAALLALVNECEFEPGDVIRIREIEK